MNSLIDVTIVGVYGWPIIELFILVWFLKRTIDLNQGNTFFKVSKKIPVFYVIGSFLIAITIIGMKQNPISGESLSLTARQNQAFSFFLLANLTTPLFPILEGMKRRKIEEIAQTTQDDD